jgi:hypothetical protein
MRKMRLSNHATPIDQNSAQTDLKTFDYVVMGKLKRTTLVSHGNIVPLGLLGILGAPYVFVSYSIEYEIQLFRPADMSAPVSTNVYTYAGKKVVGLYYNLSAPYDLFVQALEATLPEVVADIGKDVAASGKS